MKKKFNIMKFIADIVASSPRQGENETKTAELVLSVLEKHRVTYLIQKFSTVLPIFEKTRLAVDGEDVPCKGSSLVSGKVQGKENILSSLIFSDAFMYEPNINFNPKSNHISLASMYFAPAIAVDRNTLKKILKGKDIEGELRVKRYSHRSLNILVGNTVSQKTIVFAHYDSIETGATDNASGVGLLLELILSRPETLKDTLYVFSGNEELSFDKPTYWGHGYRAFEKKYRSLMQGCKKILVIDSVGNGKTNMHQDKSLMRLAFPIKNAREWEGKIFLFYGDQEKLMQVYHSEKDGLNQLKYCHLLGAEKLIGKML